MTDSTNVPLTPTAQADVREPISSGCTANPFNGDGTTCQGSAVGTPFFLFTNGTTPNLFADAYQPNTPATGGASGITRSSATVSGSVATNGAAVNDSFQFGTTAAYGHTTPAQKTAPDGSPAAFSATLSGLPAGSTIHYRAVATSDFGTFTGPDRTFRTNSAVSPGRASIGRARVSGTTASVGAKCRGNSIATCGLRFNLTVTETLRGNKVIAIGARARPQRRRIIVSVGSTSVRLTAGHSKVVKISLNGTGRRLLSKYHTLRTTLRVTQAGKRGTISSQIVKF